MRYMVAAWYLPWLTAVIAQTPVTLSLVMIGLERNLQRYQEAASPPNYQGNQMSNLFVCVCAALLRSKDQSTHFASEARTFWQLLPPSLLCLWVGTRGLFWRVEISVSWVNHDVSGSPHTDVEMYVHIWEMYFIWDSVQRVKAALPLYVLNCLLVEVWWISNNRIYGTQEYGHIWFWWWWIIDIGELISIAVT